MGLSVFNLSKDKIVDTINYKVAQRSASDAQYKQDQEYRRKQAEIEAERRYNLNLKVLDTGVVQDTESMTDFMNLADGNLSKNEYKLAKSMRRGANRTERVYYRQDARKTAYQNGIDPNGWISQSIGGLGKAAVGIFGGGAAASAASAFDPTDMFSGIYPISNSQEIYGQNPDDSQQKKSSMLPLILLGVGALFLLKRK